MGTETEVHEILESQERNVPHEENQCLEKMPQLQSRYKTSPQKGTPHLHLPEMQKGFPRKGLTLCAQYNII